MATTASTTHGYDLDEEENLMLMDVLMQMLRLMVDWTAVVDGRVDAEAPVDGRLDGVVDGRVDAEAPLMDDWMVLLMDVLTQKPHFLHDLMFYYHNYPWPYYLIRY